MDEATEKVVHQAMAISAEVLLGEIKRLKQLHDETFVRLSDEFMKYEYSIDEADNSIIAKHPKVPHHGECVAVPKVESKDTDTPGIKVGRIVWDVGHTVQTAAQTREQPADYDWETIFPDCSVYEAAIRIALMFTLEGIHAAYDAKADVQYALDCQEAEIEAREDAVREHYRKLTKE